MKILVETKRELRHFIMPFYQTVTLATLVPLSKGSNIVGEWTTPSVFLGRTSKGTYYVRDDHPSYPYFPAPGVPVAYFYDDLSTPFMVLFDFLPQKLRSEWYGRLIRAYGMITGGRFEVKWFKSV